MFAVLGALGEGLAALRAAMRMEGLLAGEHAFAPVVRARVLQTQARMGEVAGARAALDDVSEEDRDVGDMRVAAAVIHLADGEPEQAIDVLTRVLDGCAPVLHRPSTITEAQLLDAVAREQLDDQRGAEASLERALDLAEPEGVLLPFILVPVQPLLERLPGRRTAHPGRSGRTCATSTRSSTPTVALRRSPAPGSSDCWRPHAGRASLACRPKVHG
jgi:LuxR family maltose regulon positive regulatory protein